MTFTPIALTVRRPIIEMVYLMTESELATILDGMGYQAFWGPRSHSRSDIHLMLTENANRTFSTYDYYYSGTSQRGPPIKGQCIVYLSTMDKIKSPNFIPLSILCDWNLLKRTTCIQGRIHLNLYSSQSVPFSEVSLYYHC